MTLLFFKTFLKPVALPIDIIINLLNKEIRYQGPYFPTVMPKMDLFLSSHRFSGEKPQK